MCSRLSRRDLLGVPGAAVATVGLVDATGSGVVPEPLFADGFGDDTTDEYEVYHEPVSSVATTEETADSRSGVAYDAENRTLNVRAPAGVETIVTPEENLPVPETGHVQLRVRVPRTHGDDYRFAVRLVETADSWLEFRAVGDDDKMVIYQWRGDGHSGGGGSTVSEERSAGGGHHVFDFYWSPRWRSEFVDGAHKGRLGKPSDADPYDFDPGAVQLRARQCDVELTYWRLDAQENGPPGDADGPTPATWTPTGTSTGPRTGGATPSTTIPEPNSRTPTARGDEWFDGLATLATTVAVPVVGSLVLGGLLAASELRAPENDGE